MVIQVITITILGFAIVGFGSVRHRNRQRNLVVDDDDVPACVSLNRNATSRRHEACVLNGLVVVIQCVRIRCIGCSGQRLTNGLGTGLVVSYLDFGAVEIMVNGVVSLIQLEVRVVGVRLIKAIVLGRNKLSTCTGNLSFLIINGPVIENVSRRGRLRGRTLRCTRYGLDFILVVRHGAHVGAVSCHLVLNDNILLFPNGHKCIVLAVFVSCDLCCNLRVVGIARPPVVVLVPIDKHGARSILRSISCVVARFRHLCPADKLVAIACGSSLDINSFINVESLSGSWVRVNRARGTVILIPINMRRSALVNRGILGTQLDGISLGSITVVDNARVLLKNGEVTTGIHMDAGITELTILVILDDPVCEAIAAGWRHCRSSGCNGIVNIKVVVRRNSTTASAVIGIFQAVLNVNACCAGKFFTPFGVKIELLGNPPTIFLDILVVSGTVTPFVHIVGIQTRVVILSHGRFIQDVAVGIHF